MVGSSRTQLLPSFKFWASFPALGHLIRGHLTSLIGSYRPPKVPPSQPHFRAVSAFPSTMGEISLSLSPGEDRSLGLCCQNPIFENPPSFLSQVPFRCCLCGSHHTFPVNPCLLGHTPKSALPPSSRRAQRDTKQPLSPDLVDCHLFAQFLLCEN